MYVPKVHGFIFSRYNVSDTASVNGSYQINAKTDLAIRYNNQSPLENHHCTIAFQILDKPELNIFANVDQAKQQSIREVRIAIVNHC